MLESFRNIASTLIFKAFLFVIALSFVLWGVGDMFRGHTNTDVAKVGKGAISQQDFTKALHREITRMQQRFGTELTPEQIKALQLENIVLQRMINRKLVEMATADMGIVVGIPAVLNHIQDDSSFYNEKAVFDKKVFESVLQNNGLDEASYVRLLKKDMATELLMQSISAVKITPAALVNRLYRYQKEKRLVEAVRIPHTPKINIPLAKDAELREFYGAHKEQFMTPEMRAISYINLSVDDLLEGIATSENEARTEYEDNITSYQMPEKRTIDNLVFTSEAEASAAWEQLKTAKDFAAKAKEITKLEEKDRTLGTVTKTALPEEVQERLFSMELYGFTAPIKTALGWHIFRVTSIIPEKTSTFDQVRDTIIKALTRKKAEASLVNYSQKLDDEFASGATLEEAATKFGLKVRTIDNVSQEGMGEDGTSLANLPSYGNFLPLAFKAEEGNAPELILAPDNSSYFVLRVDRITPPHARSFEQAHKQVADAWKAEQMKEATAKLADTILRLLKTGQSMEEVASLQHVELLPPRQVERPVDTLYGSLPAPLPANLLREVFTLKPGNITGLHQDKQGDYYIALLRDVIEADPAKDNNGLEEAKFNLGRQSTSDITEQYMRYLHKHYPVEMMISPSSETEQAE